MERRGTGGMVTDSGVISAMSTQYIETRFTISDF